MKSKPTGIKFGEHQVKPVFYIEPLVNLYQNTFEGSTTLRGWLNLAKTTLLRKNEHTHAEKKKLSTNRLFKPHL